MYLTDLRAGPGAALRSRPLRPLHRLLPASSRRPARALERDHAPVRGAPVPAPGRGRALRARHDAPRRSASPRRFSSATRSRATSTRCSRPRPQGKAGDGASTPGRRRSASPSRSISTSPATPTWRSGLALMFGIVLPQNFDVPYRAVSLREFWRRWHMTLSRFLRDYLYIPLGGSKRGLPVQVWALFATMALGGLWHGAGPHLRGLGRRARARPRRRRALAPRRSDHADGPRVGADVRLRGVVPGCCSARRPSMRRSASTKGCSASRRSGSDSNGARSRSRPRSRSSARPLGPAAHRMPPWRSVAVAFAVLFVHRAVQDRRRRQL